jgi:hypothetical protein
MKRTIVVLDLTTGESLNFETRKETAEFIGVSLPTLRGWLAAPFYLYQQFILTQTGNGKIEKSRRALAAIVKQRHEDHKKEVVERYHVQGVLYQDRVNGSNDPQPKGATAPVDASKFIVEPTK